MKLIETFDDQKTVRLGIVKLGTAVGKMKYSLIDEMDIPIINEYKFDARLEIDRNGDGLKVHAMGHPKGKSSNPIPLQRILWENRHGPVDGGYEVCHLNNISMDNRMDNLTLVPKWLTKYEKEEILRSRCIENNIWDRPSGHQGGQGGGGQGRFSIRPPHDDLEPLGGGQEELINGQRGRGDREHKGQQRKGYSSLYWKAITQLLNTESEEQRNSSSAPTSRAYYSTEGELISRDCPYFYFFECHYSPCTAIESESREFAMCGKCQSARYCGRDCQRDDWTVHRDHCFEPTRKSSSRSHHRSIRSRDLQMDR